MFEKKCVSHFYNFWKGNHFNLNCNCDFMPGKVMDINPLEQLSKSNSYKEICISMLLYILMYWYIIVHVNFTILTFRYHTRLVETFKC